MSAGTNRQPSRTPYRERIAPPPWAMPAMGVLGAAWLFRRLRGGKQRSWPRRLFGMVNTAFTALTVLRLIRRFGQVAVEVGDDAVRVRAAGVERRLPAGDVRDVRVATYNPVRFLGWGYRIGLGGQRAFSQLGVSRGVEITVQEDDQQRRYFVSSNDPEALASAIASIAGAQAPA